MYFGVCAHVSKIIGKSLRTRSSSDSRRRERSKHYFLSFGAPKSSPRSLWGASGGLLGLLWHPPGRQLRPLGALLGAPWELRGRSWALLARSWRRFFSQLCKFSSAGLGLARFGLHFEAKTCEILPRACENHYESLPAAPRLERRIPTRVRRSREASSIRRTLACNDRERSV